MSVQLCPAFQLECLSSSASPEPVSILNLTNQCYECLYRSVLKRIVVVKKGSVMSVCIEVFASKCLEKSWPGRVCTGMKMTDEVADVINTFRVIAELPSDSLGAYVISMARSTSDVLAVVLLQREMGVTVSFPLFARAFCESN